MTGFAQRYRDEGMQLGRQEGERRVLKRQLQRRFGALSAKNTERLTEASMEDLETWAETCSTPKRSMMYLTWATKGTVYLYQPDPLSWHIPKGSQGTGLQCLTPIKGDSH